MAQEGHLRIKGRIEDMRIINFNIHTVKSQIEYECLFGPLDLRARPKTASTNPPQYRGIFEYRHKKEEVSRLVAAHLNLGEGGMVEGKILDVSVAAGLPRDAV